MGETTTVFLSRDIETKKKEYANIYQQYKDNKIKIKDIVLVDKDKIITKIRRDEIHEDENIIDHFYGVVKSGTFIDLSDQGFIYEFDDNRFIVPIYLYDAIKYVRIDSWRYLIV